MSLPTSASLKNTLAAGKRPDPGIGRDSSFANDTTAVWTGADPGEPPPCDSWLFGYFSPLDPATYMGLPPLDGPSPARMIPTASGASSATSMVSAALTQVLWLQESGTSAAISVTDINQGQMGDCYLLSSIGELALFHPSWITKMIQANADGTEAVTLWRAANGSLPTFGTTAYTPVAINVTNTFPSNSVNNGSGQDVLNGQKEIWVQVLEKAMATLYGGYSGIANGGIPSISMEELTGSSAYSTSPGAISLQQLQTAIAAGDLITFDTGGWGTLPYAMYGSHAYMFQGLSTVNGTVMVNLLNPWGFDQPDPIPFSQIGTVIDEIDIDQFIDRQTTNLGPSLAKQTPYQTWAQGSHVFLTLPTGVFSEPSGQKLTYVATQANGQACPSWLTFHASTMTFSGTVPSGMETLSLKVTATDTSGLSCSETFTATVPAAPPTLAHQTAAQTWTEGARLSFTPPSNTFADPNGQALSYAATLSNGQALPPWLTIDSTSGTFSGTVGYASGPMSIKVTATDTSGLSVSETFVARLVAPAPTVTDQTANQIWTAGLALSFALASDTFTAVRGQTLKYTATLPAGLTIDPSTGTISGTVPVTLGVKTITVRATQTSGLSVAETFKATVVASAPIAAQTQAQNWTANQPVSFTLPSDTFVDPQGEKLAYTLAGLPTGLHFNATTLTISGTSVTPATYTIKVTAKDQSGLSASETFQVAISASAPSVQQTQDQTWTANNAVSLSIASAFADPQGETLTYKASLSNGKPLPAGLTFNATTATFGGIAPTALGTLGITVTAKDQSGLSASETFQCAVAGLAPTATNLPAAQYWAANKAVSFMLSSNTFTDPQAETLTYAATMADGSALPSWLKFNATRGAFTGTAPVTPQTLALAVTATDRSGLAARQTFEATVQAFVPTVANQTGSLTWMAGKAVSAALVSNTFVDPQGEKLTWSATRADGSALPSGLTFNATTDAFSGTAPITPETLGLKVTATDASGLAVSEQFSVTIEAAAPTVAHQTANQIWNAGSSMSFLLPSNTFTDPQGAALSYAAFETSGPDQTSWLHFAAGSAAFTGAVPTGLAGAIGIKIVATDAYGLSTSESFGLTFAAAGAHLSAASAPAATEMLALHG